MKKNIVLAILGIVFVSGGLLNAMNKPEPLGMGATLENERQRLASMPQFQKIKEDIRKLSQQFKAFYYGNSDVSYDSPNNVSKHIALGEQAKKLLEEADLHYDRSSDKTLADRYQTLQSAMINYERNPSESTFRGLQESIGIALNNLERYYPKEKHITMYYTASGEAVYQ